MLDVAFYAACLLEHRELRFYIASREERQDLKHLMHEMGKRFPDLYVVYTHKPIPGVHTIVLSDIHPDLMDI